MVLSSKREHHWLALTLLVGNIQLPRQRLVEAVDVAEAWFTVVLLQHINDKRDARHRHVWMTPADQGLFFGVALVVDAVMSSAFCAEDEFR
jgi:hypothetical protein